MKQLYLCRHAKSSWKYPVDDLHRPLNKRGLQQAPQVAMTMKHQPDLILSSPAVRAYATALACCAAINFDIDAVCLKQQLYDASLSDLLAVLGEIQSEINSVMLVGHNPGLNSLLDYLVPDNTFDNIVTSARAELTLHTDNWQNIQKGCAVIDAFYTPTFSWP